MPVEARAAERCSQPHVPGDGFSSSTIQESNEGQGATSGARRDATLPFQPGAEPAGQGRLHIHGHGLSQEFRAVIWQRNPLTHSGGCIPAWHKVSHESFIDEPMKTTHIQNAAGII